MKAVSSYINDIDLNKNKIHIVFGVVSDKEIGAILNLLPKDAKYYFCAAAIPRAMNAKELQKKASEHGLKGTVYASVAKALKAAKKNSSQKDLIFIGGSTFTVAEII